MATTPDLSGNSPVGLGTDPKLNKPTRSNAGTPVGSLTPAFSGEIVLDTTNRVLWRGTGTSANTEWMPITQEAA